jgi:acyl-CoA synthetase (AMP-forming)/AMP-acid ligase II
MTIPPFQTVDQAMRHWAEADPGTPAVLALGRQPLTWGDLWQVTRQVTAALVAADIAPGSRVALLIPQSRDAEVLETAISASATPAPLNPAAPAAVLRDLGARLQPALAIATSETAAAAAALGCPVMVLEPALLIPGEAPGNDPAPRHPEDHAIILATSGSTGEPRLIPRTHENLAVSTLGWARHLAFSRDNLGMIAAPPFHAIGAYLFRYILTGSAAAVVEAAQPAAALAVIHELRPTWMLGVPSWFAAILAASDLPLPPMRMVMSGSAPMSATLAETISRRFGAPLILDYGLTEAPGIALTRPVDDLSAAPRYWPLYPGILTVADASGDPPGVPVPGCEGEVLVRGSIVFPGEIGNASAGFLPGGWYRTGDLGVVDADGAFRITGRIKQLINRGGEMISPLEIEQALQAHPAVADAIVLGVPHALLGEEIEVVIETIPGMEVPARELRRWMLDRLAPTRVPRAIRFRDQLPRLPSGKVDRRALQAAAVERSSTRD